MINHKLVYIASFLLIQSLWSQSPPSNQQPTWETAWNNIKQVGSAGVNILGGFAEGFGYCPTNRTYSMRTWNDIPQPITTVVQNLTQFLGASLVGQPIAGAKMNPFTNTEKKLEKLQGVCQGAVYLAALQNNKSVGYGSIVYDAETASLEIGGAGGTVAYVASDILSILTDIAALASGESLIDDAKLSKLSFFNRKFQTVPDQAPTYYYHAYLDKGIMKGEFLGTGLASSSEFLGVFYNNSKSDCKFNFEKDGATFNITLESQSFNTLNSSRGTTNSIRPPASDDTKPYDQRRSFTFTLGNNKTISIPIASEGLADSYTDSQNKTQTAARAYTYEIYDGTSGQDVGMQGVQIGNYDQVGVDFENAKTAIIAKLPTVSPQTLTQRQEAVTSTIENPPYAFPLITHVRDINPVTCSFWLPAAEEVAKSLTSDPAFDYSSIPINSPLDLWISYTTADSSILTRITPGTTTDMTLIRPQIKEKTGYLFVFALDTSDARKAQSFFSRLFKEARPKAYYSPVSNPLSIPDAFTLVPDNNAQVDDTQGAGASGVIGIYILKDIFMHTGIGPGPYYYGLQPPNLQLGALANIIGAYIDRTSYKTNTELNKTLMDPVISWINYYQQNKENIKKLNITDATSTQLTQAIPELTQFLQTNATSDVKKNINSALYQIIFGAVSISHPPLIWKPGTNYFTSKPAEWPAAQTTSKTT